MPITTEQRVERRLWLAAFAIFTIVVVSVVPWRTGDIYSGGADPVVVAKAVVGFAAFAFAMLLYFWTPVRGSVGIRSLTLLAGIVLISSLGALAADDASAALVLAVRIVLVAGTVVVVAKSVPPMIVLTSLLAAMGAVAIVAAITGFQHGLVDGRLTGGTPQLAPNILAGLAAAPVIGLASSIVRRGVRPWNAGLLITLVAIIFATGSRTALIVVVVGIALAFVFGGRPAASTAIFTIAAIPFAYALVALTDTVATLVARGQTIEELSTLNSRTVAWQAVLATPFDSWGKWIGVGLAAKTVEVQQRWRDVQVLDSSWVSVIAQAGIIGTLLLIIWIVWTTVESLRSRQFTALTTPLMAMLLIRSFTENGLIESSPTFMLLLALSLVLEPGTRYPGRARPQRPYALAEPLPIARRERTLV